MSAEILRVELGPRSYDLEIGSGNLARVAEFALARGKITHAIVISDSNTGPTYGRSTAESFRSAGVRVDELSVPAGEPSKSIAQAELLWNRLAQCKTDRKSVVVAVGGGVVGDLAGFIASTYARGLRFLQVPTTLLAQVDSSVGGKVGINLPTAKNMVGSFWQPLGVLIDTETLRTLPDREYRAGLAEVVKYGIILDAELFTFLEGEIDRINARDSDTLRRAIWESCRLKAFVVERDEREETGLRAVLNYGHTFGHAFEALLKYGTILHGEAVSIGMMCAARLAKNLGRVDDEFVARQQRLLTALGLPISLDPLRLSTAEVIESMKGDKKSEHGKLKFILPTRIGHVELIDGIAEGEISRVICD